MSQLDSAYKPLTTDSQTAPLFARPISKVNRGTTLK